MKLIDVFTTLAPGDKPEFRDRICQAVGRDRQWFYRRLSQNNWNYLEMCKISDLMGRPMCDLFGYNGGPSHKQPYNPLTAFLLSKIKTEFEKLYMYLSVSAEYCMVLLERPGKLTLDQVKKIAQVVSKKTGNPFNELTLIVEFGCGLDNITHDELARLRANYDSKQTLDKNTVKN